MPKSVREIFAPTGSFVFDKDFWLIALPAGKGALGRLSLCKCAGLLTEVGKATHKIIVTEVNCGDNQLLASEHLSSSAPRVPSEFGLECEPPSLMY